VISLNQSTGYAILTMACLEGPGGSPIKIQVLSASTGVPYPFLAKIVARLVARKLISTQRGYNGGVLLARPKAETTLHAIISALEMPGWDAGCLFGMKTCNPDRPCLSHEIWTNLRDQVLTHLRNTTLEDLDPHTQGGEWIFGSCARPESHSGIIF